MFVINQMLARFITYNVLLKRIEGEIMLPSNEFDHNPIHDVQMVPIKDLSHYGFRKLLSIL